MEPKPPLPPFTKETAIQKVRMAEDAWNTRDPHRVESGPKRGLRSLAGQVRVPCRDQGRVAGQELPGHQLHLEA
jgi:hypothetical protein